MIIAISTQTPLPRSRNRENSPLAMKAAKQENRNSFTVPNSKLSVKESINGYLYINRKVAKREEYFLIIILNNECRLSPLLRRKTPEKNKNRQPKEERKNTHTHTHTHRVFFTSSQLTLPIS